MLLGVKDLLGWDVPASGIEPRVLFEELPVRGVLG